MTWDWKKLTDQEKQKLKAEILMANLMDTGSPPEQQEVKKIANCGPNCVFCASLGPPPDKTKFAVADLKYNGISTYDKVVRLNFATPEGDVGVFYDRQYMESAPAFADILSHAIKTVLEYLNEGTPGYLNEKGLFKVEKFKVEKVDTEAPEINYPEVTLLERVIPGITKIKAKCPEESCSLVTSHQQRVVDLVIHLNDNAQWSREKIADWLDTLDADLRFEVEEDDGAGS